MFTSQRKHLLQNPSSLVFERKLDTPLKNVPLEKFKERIQKGTTTFQDRALVGGMRVHEVMDYKLDSSLLSWIIHRIIIEPSKLYKGRGSNFKIHDRLFDLTKEQLKLQHGYVASTSQLPTKISASIGLYAKLDKSPPPVLLNLLEIEKDFSQVINRLTAYTDQMGGCRTEEEKIRKMRSLNKYYIAAFDMTLRWNNTTILITTGPQHGSKKIICQIPYLLMIQNKLADLISIYAYTHMAAGVNLQENSIEIVSQFIEYATRMCIDSPDQYYTVASNLEGIVNAITLMRIDGDDNNQLNNAILRDIKEETGLDLEQSAIYQLLMSHSVGTELLQEIGGLSKLLGHPYVNMEETVKKIYKRTHASKNIDEDAVDYVKSTAIISFIKSYYQRKKTWPVIECLYKPLKDNPLYMAWKENKCPDDPQLRNKHSLQEVTTKDTGWFTLGKVDDFQQLESVIPYLKDKSLSVQRTSVFQNIIYKYAKDKGSSHKDHLANTRLILYYLMNELSDLDHVSFVHKYTTCDNLQEVADYLVIKIVAKEKELKFPAARGFGVKTYFGRMLSLTQETNMGYFLENYSHEQAMTMSELQICKKLYNLRTIQDAYPGYGVIFLSFDAKAWNACFRDRMLRPVMQETVDRTFGYPIFSKTQESYQNTLFYAQEAGTSFWWDGQEGGIEGLNQYTWVWEYLNEVKYALADVTNVYHILCKGDDLRVAVLIREEQLEEEPLEKIRKRIVQTFSDAMKKVGKDIKINESYASFKYLTFSKQTSEGTIEFPQVFRKIARAHGATNAFLPLLDDYISVAFSCAHSACKVSPNVYPNFYVAVLWAYHMLLQSPDYQTLNNEELLAALLLPNSLGGLPVIYLPNMFVRAQSDLLAQFLDIYIHCLQTPTWHGVARKLRPALCQQIPDVNIEKLLADPYSLNIKGPNNPRAFLQERMLKKLHEVAKNEEIVELLQAADDESMTEFLKCMDSCRPFDAAVLSVLYSAMPRAILSELLSKFEDGKSVLEFLLLGKRFFVGRIILRQVIKMDEAVQAYRVFLLTAAPAWGPITGHFPTASTCPAEYAQALRDTTWGREVIGVTMGPAEHMMQLITPDHGVGDAWAQNNHFLYVFHEYKESASLTSCDHYRSGGCKPYLGHSTPKALTPPSVNFLEKNIVTSKLKGLLEEATRCGGFEIIDGEQVESNIQLLIDRQITLYSDIDRDGLSGGAGTRAKGTRFHHDDPRGHRRDQTPNVLSNRLQNISGNTNTHITIRDEKLVHQNINFLQLLCMACLYIQLDLETCKRSSPPKRTWGVTTKCLYCRQPIKDRALRINEDLLPKSFKPLSMCKVQKQASKIITEGYGILMDKRYDFSPHRTEPQKEMCRLGLITMMFKDNVDRYRNVAALFTGLESVNYVDNVKDLAPGADPRTTGLTEMKCISFDHLLELLLDLSFEFVATSIKTYSRSMVAAALVTLNVISFPWYHIVRRLDEVKRLGPFLSFLNQHSNVPLSSQYFSVSGSCQYIAIATFHMLKSEGTREFKRTVLAHQSKEERISYLAMFFERVRWQLFEKRYMNYFLQTKYSRDDTERAVQEALLIEAMYWLLCRLDYQALYEQHIEPEILRQGEWRGNPFEFPAWEEHELLNALHDAIDCQEADKIKWFHARLNKWPTRQLVDRLEDKIMLSQDDLREPILEHWRSYAVCVVAITRADICNDLIRSEFGEEEQIVYSAPAGFVHKKWPGVRLISTGNLSLMAVTKVMPGTSIKLEEHQDFRTYGRSILSTSHYLRDYGSGTSAFNKLIHLFSASTIEIPLPSGMRIECYAEGAGGFLEGLSNLTSNSVFFFNTLQLDNAHERPIQALTSLKLNDNYLIDGPTTRGYDDLTEDATIDQILIDFEGTSPDIMTCDAEFSHERPEITIKIMMNLLRIYAIRGNHRTILIVKGQIAYIGVLATFLTAAAKIAEEVAIYRSPASSIGGEIYVIINKKRAIPRTSDASAIAINFVRQKALNIWQSQTEFRSHRGIIRPPRNRPRMTDKMVLRQIPNFLSKLASLLGIVVPIIDILKLPTKEDCLIRMHAIVAAFKSKSEMWYRRPLKRGIGASSFQTNLSEMVTIFSKIILSDGVCVALRSYSTDYTMAHIVKLFEKQYVGDHGRIKIMRSDDGVYKYIGYDNENLMPLNSFIRGIRMGHQVIGYFESVEPYRQQILEHSHLTRSLGINYEGTATETSATESEGPFSMDESDHTLQ